MPRKARMDAAGALQHIIVRGIERRRIFWDDADRDSFIKRLGQVLTETQTVLKRKSCKITLRQLAIREYGVKDKSTTIASLDQLDLLRLPSLYLRELLWRKLQYNI